jgi:Xaa-Pro aminopeptidase
MITMNPVLLHGRSVWDQSYFPLDECEERLKLVRAEMARDGLQCLVVFGHCTEYGDLCYLTQYIPMAGWSMVTLPAEGDPVLVLGLGGGREIPSARARTWVEDVRGLPSLGDGLAQLLAGLRIDGPVGLIGADHSLPARLYDEVVAAIGQGRCVAAQGVLVRLRQSLRPREISAIREAARIVQRAAAAFTASIESGYTNAAAMVEADGTARRLRAHDFRGLVNLSEGGSLEPLTGSTSFRSGSVVAYLAASFLGYWADLAMTTGATGLPALEDARQALRAMVECVRAGATGGEVAQRASDELGATYSDQVGRRGFGCAKGLTLHGSPRIAARSDELLVENSILGLEVRMDGLDGRTGPGAVVSDLVLVKADGCESLLHRA